MSPAKKPYHFQATQLFFLSLLVALLYAMLCIIFCLWQDTKDNLKLCLTHPGTGSIYFKAESEDITMKWVKVFQNAVKLKLTDDTD